MTKLSVMDSASLLVQLEEYSSILFVCDENTQTYAREIIRDFKGTAHLEVLRAGEDLKSFQVLEPFLEKSVAVLDRRSAFVAVGGGAVLDFVGFASSILYRGVPCYLVPTSLLAMVDAAIGGKSAINLKAGKNLVGSFTDPKGVVLNFEALSTLPENEILAGIGELLKTSILDSPEFFRRVREIILEGTWKDIRVYPSLIHSAIQFKMAVVEADYHEKGQRVILNLGHSFAHALEAFYGYHISHGQSVLVGLMLEAKLGVCLGLVDPDFEEDLSSLISALPLPKIPDSVECLLPFLKRDKKNRDARIGFVFFRRPGLCSEPGSWVRTLSPDELKKLAREAF
jgi:3-dehydroquinate synthase